eukprot:gene13401-biopygen7376
MRCDVMRCAVRGSRFGRPGGSNPLDAMRCDAMRCDAMWCDAMRCDAMRCAAMQCALVYLLWNVPWCTYCGMCPGVLIVECALVYLLWNVAMMF